MKEPTYTESGINWSWVWYDTEERACEVARNTPEAERDKTRDNEYGFCVAFR